MSENTDKLTHDATGKLTEAEINSTVAISRPLTYGQMDNMASLSREELAAFGPAPTEAQVKNPSASDRLTALHVMLAAAKKAYTARLGAVVYYQDLLDKVSEMPTSEELVALTNEVAAACDAEAILNINRRKRLNGMLDALMGKMGDEDADDGEGGLSFCDCEGPEDCPNYERDKGSKLKGQGTKPSPAVH